MKLYFKNFEIYLFYFPGAAAEPLGSARGALRAERSTGWEPLSYIINPFNAELNPICHLQALLGAHHILHVSRIRVKFVTGNFISV